MSYDYNNPPWQASWDHYGNVIAGVEPYPVRDMSSQTMATQTLRLSYFTAPQTRTLTTTLTYTGSTAAGATPTVCRVGLYSVAASGDITLVASTANDTTLWASINTEYPKDFSAPYTVSAGQRYAFGVLVVSVATIPTFLGISIPAGMIARAPRRSAVISGQTDLPASLANATLSNSQNWLYVAAV